MGTQAADVRSAHREEVEIFKWDSQANRMREWRSYNTGIRLAIGSNVVVSPENRKSLENEYRDYRKTIRTEMPVGRTLDNPVAQAATQLNDAQATLETIMEQNSHLRRPLSSIQRFIEQAEEKLDHAQRETARSTAQDALRAATDLGRDLFKLESLRQQQAKAERLGELSTRYQDLVTTIKTEIARRQEYARQLLERYGEDLGNLGEYSPAYISQALKALGEKKLTNRAAKALELLTRHVEHYQTTRRVHWDAWWGDFNEGFKNLAD